MEQSSAVLFEAPTLAAKQRACPDDEVLGEMSIGKTVFLQGLDS